MHDVPFAALYDGSRYLLESYEVTIAPSAGTVAMCRRPRGRLTLRSLVAAHSDRGRFPWVIDEAHTVADFFPGEVFLEEEATLAAVREGAVTADVIHVAAHGVSRVDAPLFSNVRLADGEFTALDWLDLELDCALVTLSACESGIGTVTPGDEPVGLSRSLLYAGARSVLQTLWRVDDQATSTLMRAFYRRLRDGRGRGEALQLAQLELLQASAASGTTHPFFWAAFALVGDWRPLLSDSPHVQKGEQRAVIQHI